jgi:biotin carboxylase
VGDEISQDELEPKHQIPVIQRYAFPKPGKIVRISGVEDARKIPGIADVIVTAKPGDIIPPAGDKRPSAAMVLATGTSRTTALQAADDALACLKIETA